jgi:hypothetical protein
VTSNTTTNNGKKNVSVLGLAPIQPQSPGNSVLGLGSLAPINPPQYPANRAITKRERQIIDTFHEEVLVIDATEAKAEFGMYKLGQMHQRASDLFVDTVSFMLQNKEETRGTEVEPYVAEFTLRQIQMYASHILGTLEVAGTRIGEEVHRSLHLPSEQKGFWARVLGR